jgi:hypothetical protein
MINRNEFNLIAFKAISTFTNELSENFGTDKQNHSLKLYDHLMSKTLISHDAAIKKHIDIFTEFCILNRDALYAKDAKKFVNTRIVYSEKVYIEFNNIFKKADTETVAVIWKHLLTISALLDPAGKAKEILKQSNETTEADFLTNIINKVESHVSPDSNPMEAVTSIMNSGVFTELLTGMNSGIQDGTLDLGKLMGTVQKICTNIGDARSGGGGGDSSSSGGDNKMNESMGAIASLLSAAGSSSSQTDPSQLVSMLGPMLSGFGAPKPPPVEVLEEDSETS